MCGIAGWLAPATAAPEPQVLGTMLDALAHRGPDDHGSLIENADRGWQVALGHRRLSIIDLSTGHQPMVDRRSRVAIVFNGEIYNYRALREELSRAGSEFETASDTEVILKGYLTWGEGCVERLSGMFAFALWDPARSALLLVRDRFGKKPLFIASRGGGLFFASEIKSLLRVPGLRPEVDAASVREYLTYRYVPGPNTLLRGIEKLPPATLWEITPAARNSKRFYDLPDRSPCRRVPLPADPARTLRGLFFDAVKARMVSDVPFGAFLSGGIDSSAVVAAMTEVGTERVRTFSVGFADAPSSELGYASIVARRFGTDHQELSISAEDVAANLARCTWHRDAPVSEPADIPIYLLAQAARREVKMVLTGEGSDEILGGYPKHRFERMAGPVLAIPAGIRRRIFGPLARRLPFRFSRQAIAVAALAEPGDRERMIRWFGALSPAEVSRLAPDLPARDGDGYPFSTLPGDSALRRILFFDQSSWLPDNLLERGDRMTMAASLEARMPFMAHELAEWISALPDRFRVHGWQGKWLLYRALKDVLPPEILARPKAGFTMPVASWMRSTMRSFVCDRLLAASPRIGDYVEPSEVRRYVAEHLAGDRNHEKTLWMLLALEMWLETLGASGDARSDS